MQRVTDAIRAVLGDAVGRGEVPGAAAVAGTLAAPSDVVTVGLGRVAGARAFSRGGGGAGTAAAGAPHPRDAAPIVTAGTRYDLASLTKVMATLPAILALAADGLVHLDDPVRRFFSNAGWFQQPTLADATVRQLLAHRSGLPAWEAFFARAARRDLLIASALQTPLDGPPDRHATYSDVGFIVLGAIVERVTGVRLDAFARRRVWEPLGLHATAFGPVRAAPVAATEDCGWRGVLLEGVVHDENAFAMDGVAGHAGVFATAADVAGYARAWLAALAGGRTGASASGRTAGPLDDAGPAAGPAAAEPAPNAGRPGLPFGAELAREAVRDHGGGRGLGWQLAGPASAAGALASDGSFGHTGFTGTSVWIDPRRGWFAVLLTNRVHPDRSRGQGIHDLRRTFHDAVAEALAHRPEP